MPHRPGDEAYSVFYDDEDRKIYFTLEVCRSVRKGRAFYTSKIDHLTWKRLSKKAGDFGWCSNIPIYCRRSIGVDAPLPEGWGRTKLAAVRSQLANLRQYGKPKEYEEDARELAALARYVKRYGKPPKTRKEI